jgi:hypothetical protein
MENNRDAQLSLLMILLKPGQQYPLFGQRSERRYRLNLVHTDGAQMGGRSGP